MSQIDNDISVHDGEGGDEPRDAAGDGNGTGASPAPKATSSTRTRSSSKRAPAASKSSTPRKRKASSSNGGRPKKATTAKAASDDDPTATATTDEAATADEAATTSPTEELRDGSSTTETSAAVEELPTDDEVRGADASAAVQVSEPVEDPTARDDQLDEPVAIDDGGDRPEPAHRSGSAAYFEVVPLGDGPSTDAPDEADVELEATTASSSEPDADDDGAAGAAETLDPEYLSTLPPPPVAAARPRRLLPPKPTRPASREPVIDLDEAEAERPDVTVDAHGITVEAQEPVPDVPVALTKRAQFWVRRQLKIPSDDPDYLATLPPPPAAIDLRAGDDEAEAGGSVQQRPLEVSALAADQSSAGAPASAAPSASVTDPAEEQHVPDAAAPTVSSSGPTGGSGDGPFDLDGPRATTATGTDDELDLITAPAGQASADTSTSDELVDLSEVQDPTESTVLPTDEDGVPRWVGRTDDVAVDDAVATPTRVEPARTDDDEDDDGDDTVVAPLPKQSRAERRKEWRKVEQARRYAARRSVRFPILTRSIILWCLIFALAGMAAGGTAALFWSHFNTEIAELREKTDDFEQRSQTAEARIEDLRKQAIDDINRGKAELAPALAEGRVVQAASIFSPFVWFVDTLDDKGQSSVGSAFAVNSDDRETILVTSFNTVKASTVRPSPEINLRKGGDVIRAELVQWDAERDLALLKIDRGNQAVLDWADDGTQRQQLGSRVYAVSGLGGAGASVNPGVVSDQIAQGFLHDVRLGGQSQGSPIVTAEGKVIGVASQVYRPLNIDTGDLHYAVRIDMACERLLDCSTVARRARG